MNAIEFLVQGSALEPYRVKFQLSGRNLNAHCSCPAGAVGQYCKHRFNILAGVTTGIVSHNSDMVPGVVAMLPGTDVEAGLALLASAETDFERAKKALSAAQNAMAAALNR